MGPKCVSAGEPSCSARCGVKTEEGDDVVNFRAELKLKVVYRNLSIDRSGAAWDRTGRVGTPSSSSGKN